MTNFVLVHDAWHGGWCWVRIAGSLINAGLKVLTRTLTALGDCAHLDNRDIDLDTLHITDFVRPLFRHYRQRNLMTFFDMVHSYGGIVITGAAVLIFEKLSSITEVF